MGTHSHKSRIYYSFVIEKARQDCNIDKHKACYYFARDKAYQKATANRSYADALKFGKSVTFHSGCSEPLPQKQTTATNVKANTKSINAETPANRVHVTKCLIKVNERQYQKLIRLHNRFDVLQHIDTQEGDVHSVCYETTDESPTESNRGNVINQPGASCPALDCRFKTPLAVKKNETGCPDGDRNATRLCGTETVSKSCVRDVSTDRKLRI